MAEIVAQSSGDPQKTIDDVVNNVKSEGLFDQFRKECLEEFENMETYHQLKQRVENHVTSFLSKHKYHDGLQKNLLRNNLRTHISKSDILLNSIQQLVDEVLSLKGHSFCLKIDKEVDKYLNKDESIVKTSQDCSSKTEEKEECTEEVPIQDVGASKEKGNRDIMTEVTEIEEVEMEINDNPSNIESEEHNPSNSNPEIFEVSLESKKDSMAAESQKLDNPDKNIENKDENKKTLDELNATTKNTEENSDITHVISEEEPSHDIQDVEQKIVCGITKSNKSTDIDENVDAKNGDGSAVGKVMDCEENEKDELADMNLTKQFKENKVIETTNEINEFTGHIPPLITEPISDDSASNHSSFTEETKALGEVEQRRKSNRVRSLPLKLRQNESKTASDDNDSISSNDTEVKTTNESSSTQRHGRHKRKRSQHPDDSRDSYDALEKRSSRGKPLPDSDKHKKAKKRDRSVGEIEEASRSGGRKTKKKDLSSDHPDSVSQREDIVASPVNTPDDNANKRTRRPIKQRRCYSPS
ncbi:biorientation of chromosomes in cell division protein 1-like 1 [Hydractinia symbiolongicarpus]|uniref:biorientation of chromosomes in cell division protein 1-like 1 n=1 Tax=Hydractinia symbiolongicarpus TaxID=13093 RepID=UPI00254D873C|nr:biorientation of chromosomes in cell division protein 1-like 1 [Hydractinia symbiolongicarpus]